MLLWGWSIPVFQDLNCLFVTPCFVLTVKVYFPGKDIKIMGKEDTAELRKYSLGRKLYEKMVDTDFTLIFRGAPVPCHKLVLAAASPVFKAMVDSLHLEAMESKATIDIPEEVGLAFIEFIYTGELDERALEVNSVALLELGEKYDVQELKDLAEVELLHQLDKNNMVEFVSIGDLFNAERISEAALKMTKANMNWLRSQVCGIIA